MSVLNNNALVGAAGKGGSGGITTPQRSLRFSSADSSYLSKTFSSAGNRKKWTWSGWVKSSVASRFGLFGTDVASDADNVLIQIDSSYRLAFSVGYTTAYGITTTAVFRDPTAWQHVVAVFDCANPTPALRMRLFVNGTELTSFADDTRASLPNQDWGVNGAIAHSIGRNGTAGGVQYFNGYLANIHFIDGQALTPSDFAYPDPATGRWEPKAYAGSYSGNSFYLDFSDNSAATATALGADRSGLGNNWVPNNISVGAGSGNDSLRDHPVSAGTSTGVGGEVSGNYATLNPLISTSSTLSNGNLDYTSTGTYQSAYSTIGMPSGKWYFEGTCTQFATDALIGVGYAPFTTSTYVGGSATSWGYEGALGDLYTNSGGSSFGNTYTTNDIISVAFDADTGKLWFAKNGTWQASGNPANGTNPAVTLTTGRTYFFGVSAANTGKWSCNYGARAFAYTAPSGFKALCDTNLPDPLIKLPSTVMDVTRWNGTGVGGRAVTGLNFNPDLVWLKRRSSGGTSSHQLHDAVRGASAGALYSDLPNTQDSNFPITSFDSTGFTLGSSASLAAQSYASQNETSQTYVGWCWDAGSSTVTLNPGDPGAGSITSSVRANASAGFSVVGWNYPSGTGASTIGHGLGVKPGMIILKNRDAGTNWIIYHSSIGATKCFRFTTAAASTESDPWNNTEPTSSVFSIGAASWHGSGNFIAYCFAPVSGYSSFGSYTGSSDLPFIYTGFRIRWLLIKRTNDTSNWTIIDTQRDTYNLAVNKLFADTSTQENVSDPAGVDATNNRIDILSNGFKHRDAYTWTNGAGSTYIYAAFAESPFKYARAR